MSPEYDIVVESNHTTEMEFFVITARGQVMKCESYSEALEVAQDYLRLSEHDQVTVTSTSRPR